MRTFKTKYFAKWAEKEKIGDIMLNQLIQEMNMGIIDAPLGAGLVKQRLSKPGHGKSGSYRLLIAYQYPDKAIFLTGFSKRKEAT